MLQILGKKIRQLVGIFFSSFTRAFAWGIGIAIIILFIVFVFNSFYPILEYKGEFYKYVVLKKLQIEQKDSLVDAHVEDIDENFFANDVEDVQQIAVLNMQGTIMPECYYANDICPSRVVPFLNFVKTNDNIKGLVIQLNSPGGEVYASERIYQAIKEVAKIKPVYVYAESEIASGAYYISMGANKVFASPVSIVGSIGVYFEVYNYNGLLDKLGIKHKFLVSKNAKYKVETEWLFKDNEDGKYVNKALQEIVDDTERMFRKRVKDSRPNANIDVLQGLVVTATKAQQLGLIDGIYDNLEDLYLQMAKDLKLVDSVYIVDYYLQAPFSATGVMKNVFKEFATAKTGTKWYLMYK